jgi:hypothetical protein
MSNPRAIAAVTATLRSLLAAGFAAEAELNDAQVTAQPLDKARDAAATVNQLNLFLYLISLNPAWRNQDTPGRVRPGEVASPPLALNLFYLLSAYGRDSDVASPFSHMLLGQAMSTLYDHPLLGQAEIAAALPGSDLGNQIERLRITLQPLSLDDISKLWAGPMQYQLSVAFEVAVVLIDSTRPTRAAAPVLARGPSGRGFTSTTDLLSAWPQIRTLTPARPLRHGETLKVTGTALTGDTIAARFAPVWHGSPPVDIPAVANPDGGFTVTIPPNAVLPAGPHMFSLRLTTGSDVRPTVEMLLMLAPRITSAMPARVALGGGNPTLRLTVAPPVLATQRVALILGDQEIPADTAVGGQLTFTLTGVTTGTYLARVRVDGVDSLLLVDPDAPEPAFDRTQSIVVTA